MTPSDERYLLTFLFPFLGDMFKMQAFQISVLLLKEKYFKRGLKFSVQVHSVPVPITLDHSQKSIGNI